MYFFVCMNFKEAIKPLELAVNVVFEVFKNIAIKLKLNNAELNTV